MRKDSLFSASLMTSLVCLALVCSGCASEPADPDPTYSENPFFAGGGDRPAHQRKANVDFFNKVCTPTGPDGYQSGSYHCYFTDD